MARIGIIGTGWGARVQIPAFRTAGLDVTAIAGRDAAKTLEIAGQFGIAHAYADWRELVVSRDVDLVSVVAPPSRHLEMSLAAMDAEKHVLCEKPTALDAQQAERMATSARRHTGLLTLIDHELRFLPAWQTARTRVPELGELRHIDLRYSSPSRASLTRPWNWWSDEKEGGGILGAVGSHLIDAVRYLCAEIAEVRAVLHTFVRERHLGAEVRPVTSDDWALVHLRLDGGSFASLMLSAVAAVDEPTTITIHGEKGGLLLTGSSLFETTIGGAWEEVVSEEAACIGDSPGGAFGTGTMHLGRALRRALDDADSAALEAAATFEDGLRVQRALDAARLSSHEEGCWIPVWREQPAGLNAPEEVESGDG